MKIGERFGKLTIVGFKIRGNETLSWFGKCDCGNIKLFRAFFLKIGRIKSCGCMRTAGRLSNHPGLNKHFNAYKYGAKTRNIKFELTFDELIEITKKNCHYCGAEPRAMNPYLKADFSLKNLTTSKLTVDRSWVRVNGIDRMDSDIGYTLSNCVPACHVCNSMKLDINYPDFLKHVRKINKFINKRCK